MKTEYFCLYGMRFTVSGDTKKARALAYQARRLQFQLSLSDVPQLHLQYSDGSYVNVLRQAGMDFAKIHVPEVFISEQPELKERQEVFYRPAFHAIDVDDNFIGFVISKSEGWDGPYELIIPIEDSYDNFDYGQWLENYSERPFDDLDEYLKLNFINRIITQDQDRLFYEIPPHGTINRSFETVSDSASNDTGTLSDPYCVECPELDQLLLDFTKNLSGEKTESFIVFDAGANGETRGSSINLETDKIIPIGQKITNDTRNASGQVTVGIAYFGGNECSSGTYIYPLNPIDIVNDFNWGMFFTFSTGVSYETEDDDVIVNRLYWTAHREELTQITKWYATDYSSVEDEQHYAIGYASRDEEYQIDAVCSVPADGICAVENANLQTTSTTTYSNQSVTVLFSGESFQLEGCSTTEVDYIFDNPGDACIYPRYYHVDGLEFVLGIFLLEETDEGNVSYRFFYGKKSSTISKFASSFELTSEEEPVSYKFTSKVPFPHLLGPGGQELYVANEFRLIKEVVTTKDIKE